MQTGVPYTIATLALTPGIYFVRISDDARHTVTYKLIKQ